MEGRNSKLCMTHSLDYKTSSNEVIPVGTFFQTSDRKIFEQASHLSDIKTKSLLLLRLENLIHHTFSF